MRILATLCALLVAAPLAAQDAIRAAGGVVRVLDKTTGQTFDLDLLAGQTARVGSLIVTLRECRYPAGNPTGDAFELLTVTTRNDPEPVFEGWMIASAPALNALDHPRYDVWALRCTIS